MFCANCGTQNADGTKFCKSCGKELVVTEVISTPAASPAPAPTAAPSAPVATAAPAAADGTMKYEKPAFIIGIIAVVLALLSIPVLSWFALPLSVIGFALALQCWQAYKHDGEKSTIQTTVAIAFNAYVLVDHFALLMGGGDDLIASALNLLSNMY